MLAFKLAQNLLWHRSSQRRRTRPMRAAIVSIALSMVPFVLVLEVSEGMIVGILNRYMETASGHARVYFNGPGSQLEPAIANLRQLEEVRYAGVEVEGPALVFFHGKRQAIQLRGLASDRYQQDRGFASYMRLVDGEFSLKNNQVVIGEATAEQLELSLGDELTLLTAAVLPNGKLLPKTTLLKVSGISSVGYRELDKLWVFINYELASQLLHPSASRKSLVVKTDHPSQVSSEFKRKIRQNLALPLSAVVLGWKDLSRSLRQNFEVSQALLLLIMALVMALALTNISSSLIMMVLENHQQIGVLKVCGAQRNLLLTIYLWVGLTSTMLAMIPGVMVGLLISWQINRVIFIGNLLVNWVARLFNALPPEEHLDLLDVSYYLEQIPVTIKVMPLLLIMVTILVFGLLASWLPAWRASRLDPLRLLARS